MTTLEQLMMILCQLPGHKTLPIYDKIGAIHQSTVHIPDSPVGSELLLATACVVGNSSVFWIHDVKQKTPNLLLGIGSRDDFYKVVKMFPSLGSVLVRTNDEIETLFAELSTVYKPAMVTKPGLTVRTLSDEFVTLFEPM
jgi:hypothetical protein